ncbi:MAG: DNA-deoxyinosine glycosylase [Proteobacteria bacterium]|nr:DNA-deoxyinosine glycosylase [Pseudomonadota bacterium]
MPIEHPIPPVFLPQKSNILILGSFPSVKSREMAFFYGHPQNRFWRIMANLFEADVPQTIEQKKQLLLSNHIAVWDVVASCNIEGSADSTMRDVTVNDLSPILSQCPIKKICVNGKTAEKYYKKYTFAQTGRQALLLPSSSPANAAWSLERLTEAWRTIIFS